MVDSASIVSPNETGAGSCTSCPAEIGDDAAEGARGERRRDRDDEGLRHLHLRRQVQRTPGVHQRFLGMECPCRRVHEAFAGTQSSNHRPDLFDHRAVVRDMIRREALLLAPGRRPHRADSIAMRQVMRATSVPSALWPRINVRTVPAVIDVEHLGFGIQRIAAEQRAVHGDVVEARGSRGAGRRSCWSCRSAAAASAC